MSKSKKGDNLAKYSQNFAKVNQIIYTLDTICMALSNTLILAQWFSRYFVDKVPKVYDAKVEKRAYLSNVKSDGKEKKNIGPLMFLFHILNFKSLSLNVLFVCNA